MFSLVSGVYDSYFAPTKLNLLVVGANGTGKTALLERLKVTQFTKIRKPKQPDEELVVPQSFLPVKLRQSNPPAGTAQAPKQQPTKRTSAKKKSAKTVAAGKPKRRSFLACPAPSKYQKEESDDEDIIVEEDDEDDNINESETTLDAMAVPDHNGIGHRNSSLDMSLEEVSLRDSTNSAHAKTNNKQDTETGTTSPTQEGDQGEKDIDDDSQEDFDLKNQKHRMLPLHKIRPTIGMNLGKVEMCGAQCHVWDLGGKMHDLWSRYYADCDAVVFVWKIVDDSKPPPPRLTGDNDDSDDDDELPWVTAEQQLALLQEVRKNIGDDIPFLIWGHWFPPQPNDKTGTVATAAIKKDPAYQYNQAYDTGSLLPHYHNPLMSVYFGSAKTGAGVRTAMEWLIPTAIRQKKFREKTPITAEDGED